MAKIYLGLGSNEDAERHLKLGIRELRHHYGQLDVSHVYQNAAFGFDGSDFLNLVVGLDADETPADIHGRIEPIHDLAGRKRGSDRLSSRPLDIDLLLYDDLVIDDPPIRLPRNDVLDYSFVLRPLAELAPDLVHPVSGQTMQNHWDCFDAASHPLVRVDLIL